MQQKKHIETFFKENYTRLYYYAYKMVEDKAAAEDLVQDVFLKIWNQPDAIRSGLLVKPYVYTSIKNACLNFIRHQKVREDFANNQVFAGAEENEKGLELLIRAEVIGQIHQAIENLPAGCRSVLKLAYFESLKNEEIASRLGISINTVKTQKARALQLLRMKLTLPAYLLFYCLLQK